MINFVPSERESSMRPPGVLAEDMTFVSSLRLTCRRCNCFVAAFETFGGVPSRTVEPLLIFCLR